MIQIRITESLEAPLVRAEADRWGRFGIGADISRYRTSADLRELYDGSRSCYIFLRWRPTSAPASHVH